MMLDGECGATLDFHTHWASYNEDTESYVFSCEFVCVSRVVSDCATHSVGLVGVLARTLAQFTAGWTAALVRRPALLHVTARACDARR